MKFVKVIKAVAVFMSVAIILGIAGVSATWKYNRTPADYTDGTFHSHLLFWNGVEDIPENPNVLGENHRALIINILEEASYGLNATKKPVIHNTLNYDGAVIYAEQNVQGGNLKHILIDGTSSSRLLFQIHREKEGRYITLTYSYADLYGATINETHIEAFVTIMVEGTDGVWSAIESYGGTALVKRNNGSIRYVDINSFMHY